jgi:iron complex transport system ATP-binding protein
VDRPVLEAEDVYFEWPTGVAVAGVDFRVAAGEMVAVVGPNGAGKSTFLRLLSGYLSPSRGAVRFRGLDLRRWRRRDVARAAAFVPQYSEVNVPYVVSEMVALGRYPRLGPFRAPAEDDRRAVTRAMALAGVETLAGRRVSQLSGGEFQRVILARALAQEASLLFLDEPTAHLDISHQARFFSLLRDLNEEETLTIVAVTHDLNLAAAYFRRVVLLARGRKVADGPPAEVLRPGLLTAVYGWPVAAWETPGGRFVFPAREPTDKTEGV